MTAVQNIIQIEKEELLDRVYNLNAEGWRLVQMCATKGEKLELNYSFDKDYELTNLRFYIETGEEITSISGIYFNAFLYENELHDLFGIPVRNMKIDFQGNLYRTKIKSAFNPEASAKPASEPEQEV